jgi:hypothetical protein
MISVTVHQVSTISPVTVTRRASAAPAAEAIAAIRAAAAMTLKPLTS